MLQDPNSEDYNPIFCRALYDYKSADPSALSLRTGDVIEVLTQQPSGWWDGLLYDTRGWFPSNYVEIIPDEEVDEALAQVEMPVGYYAGNIGDWPIPQLNIPLSEDSMKPQQANSDDFPPAISTSLQNDAHQSDFWIPEVAPDGHIYYVNTKTGLRSLDLPADTEEENLETVVLGMTSTRIETSANLAFGPRGASVSITVIEDKGNEDESIAPLPPAIIPTLPLVKSNAPSPTEISEGLFDQSVHETFVHANREQEFNQQFRMAFQQAMEPQSPSPNHIQELSSVAQDAIGDVINTIQSSIVTRSPKIDQIMDGLVYEVVLAVRNLLYIATALPANQIVPVSHHDGTHAARTLSSSQPPRSHQRKITAILSRLVLSVRALVYNSGSSLADTRNRIQKDAEELLKDVRNFVVDFEKMEKSRHLQKNLNAKRLNGVFSVAEVASVLGAGDYPPSWKGFGHHNFQDNKLKNFDIDVVLEIDLFVEQLLKRSSDLRGVLQSMTMSSEYQLCSMIQTLITRTSDFLSFIADIYVSLDIKGGQQLCDSSGAAEYHTIVKEAAHLVRYAEAVIQAIYDDSSSLLLVTQTLQQGSQNPTIDTWEDKYEGLGQLLTSLDEQLVLVKRIFARLLSLGQLVKDDVKPNGPVQLGDADDIGTSLEKGATEPQNDVIDLETSFQRIGLRKSSFVGHEDPRDTFSTGNSVLTTESSLTTIQGEATDDTSTIEEIVDVDAKANKSPSRPVTSNKLQRLLGDEYAERVAVDLRPWYLRPNYAPSDIIIDADNSVRGGTLSSLVERLTAHDQADSTYTKAFLLTYNSYTTLDQLFDLLVARFRIQQPEGLTEAEKEEWVKMKQHVIRTRVINTMKAIVDSTLEQEDGHILAKMKDFLSSDEVSGSAAAKHLLVQIDRLITQGGNKTLIITNQEPPPLPISPNLKVNKKLQLLDIDPLELARQFTLIESQLYQRIKNVEALQRARVQKGEHDDNISAVIQMSNQIAEWVADCILSKEDSRGRAQVLKHLIIVAERCRGLNNFSTMSAIVSGLNTPPIRRLKRTWEQVNRRHISSFENCEVVIDSAKTFTKYKSLMTSVIPPCIPFLGVFLSTLQFIQDGNPDYLSPGMVNFRKFQKASEIIIEIKRWQTQSYNLQPLPAVIAYINTSLRKFSGNARETSDYFWALSLAREPREREDEKMARLLQESGF